MASSPSADDVVPTTEEILEAVRSVQEEAIEFLRSIVSIDSTLEKGEGRVQDAIFYHMVRVLGAGESSSSSNSRPSFEVTRRSDVRTWRGRYEGWCGGHDLRDRGIAPTGIRPGGRRIDDMHSRRGGMHRQRRPRLHIRRRWDGGRSVYDWYGGCDHEEDGRHHTGAVPVDCHRPARRALVHGVGDGPAMSRPIDVERIERHRGGVRPVQFLEVVGGGVQRAEGERPSCVRRIRPSRQLQPREDIGGELGEFRAQQV